MTEKSRKAGKVGVRKSLASRLRVRKALKSRKPGFKRQEGFKKAKLKKTWRSPKGRHSKLRKREKARGKVVSIGFGSPGDVRGLNRMGYREVRVSSVRQVSGINPREEMMVISSAVGKKKREELLKAAGERKIHVSNA